MKNQFDFLRKYKLDMFILNDNPFLLQRIENGFFIYIVYFNFQQHALRTNIKQILNSTNGFTTRI